MGQGNSTFKFPKNIDGHLPYENIHLASLSPELHPSKNKCSMRLSGVKSFDSSLLATTAALIKSVQKDHGLVKIYDGEPHIASISMGDKNQFKTPAFRAMYCALLKTYMNAGLIPYACAHLLRAHQQDTVFLKADKARAEAHPVDQVACIMMNSDTSFLLICDRPENEDLCADMCRILDEYWVGYGEKYECIYKGAAVCHGYSGKISEFELNKKVFSDEESLAYCKARKLFAIIANCFGRCNNYNFLTTMNCSDQTDILFFAKYSDKWMPTPAYNADDMKILYLGSTNLIACIDFPQDQIDGIKDLCKKIDWNIETHDSVDLHEQEGKSVLSEWLLERSHPFWTRGNAAVMARHFVINVVENMMKGGYHPAQSMQLSRKHQDKGVINFVPGPKVEKARYLILSYSELGDVYFTGLFDEEELSKWVTIIRDFWPGGISKKLEYADRRLSPFVGDVKSWQIRMDKGPS
jgi:hypothetical protein